MRKTAIGGLLILLISGLGAWFIILDPPVREIVPTEPRWMDEAIPIAMQVPEFRQASGSGTITFSEEDGVWVVKVKTWENSVWRGENYPVVFIDPTTKEVIKVYRISGGEAGAMALLKFVGENRVLWRIPYSRPLVSWREQGDHWIVDLHISATDRELLPWRARYSVNRENGDVKKVEEVAWETAGDLKLTLSVPKTEYRPEENVIAKLEIKNVGENPITLKSPVRYLPVFNITLDLGLVMLSKASKLT